MWEFWKQKSQSQENLFLKRLISIQALVDAFMCTGFLTFSMCGQISPLSVFPVWADLKEPMALLGFSLPKLQKDIPPLINTTTSVPTGWWWHRKRLVQDYSNLISHPNTGLFLATMWSNVMCLSSRLLWRPYLFTVSEKKNKKDIKNLLYFIILYILYIHLYAYKIKHDRSRPTRGSKWKPKAHQKRCEGRSFDDRNIRHPRLHKLRCSDLKWQKSHQIKKSLQRMWKIKVENVPPQIIPSERLKFCDSLIGCSLCNLKVVLNLREGQQRRQLEIREEVHVWTGTESHTHTHTHSPVPITHCWRPSYM